MQQDYSTVISIQRNVLDIFSDALSPCCHTVACSRVDCHSNLASVVVNCVRMIMCRLAVGDHDNV